MTLSFRFGTVGSPISTPKKPGGSIGAVMPSALVHLANASYRLGRTLRFDPATEKVIDDEEANLLLRGSYRRPYVVPEQV